ncbi:LTA synthase family protein [Fibrobacter sp.]|uniref:LTA synthase family protein n=1 Tax=Fibrobacter sp. TaxID=35828 RepID=UPI00387030CF
MSVHIYYVIACLVLEVLFVIVHRKSSSARQISGMFFIPFFLYLFTYRYSILRFLDDFQTLANSTISFILTLFLCSLSFEVREYEKTKVRSLLWFSLFSFLLIFLSHGIPWMIKAFPLENPEAVLFTLQQNNVGIEGFVWDMIWQNILRPSLLIYVPICIVITILSLVVHYSKKTWCFKLFQYRARLYPGVNLLYPLKQLFKVMFTCSLIIFLIIAPKLIFPLIDICKVYMEPDKKQNSQLYLREYVFPDSASIVFPQEKKNLIYIMLESMEVNFKDYTPEINRITQENISFKPGGVDVVMTGWTMAAQVSKLCGIPLDLPQSMENSDSIYSFLPYVKCITDVLDENGYHQIYVQGSDGSFSSKRNFWNQHKVKEFHDYPYYKKEGAVPDKKEIFWGVTDRTLYGLVQKELDELGKDSSKPFALYMMTVDTHFPEGYMSDGCAVAESETSQYPSALRCASKQVESFLKWAETQDWYKNTVIVFIGDHTWSTFTGLLGLNKEAPLYWINVFLNTQISLLDVNRSFCSFDMFPTVLEAMGVEITGHRLGLGTSLFSSKKTLLEKMPKSMLDSILKVKSFQYDYFWHGGSFVGE